MIYLQSFKGINFRIKISNAILNDVDNDAVTIDSSSTTTTDNMVTSSTTIQPLDFSMDNFNDGILQHTLSFVSWNNAYINYYLLHQHYVIHFIWYICWCILNPCSNLLILTNFIGWIGVVGKRVIVQPPQQQRQHHWVTLNESVPHGKNDGGICIIFCTDYKFNLKSMDDDKLVSTPLKKKQQQDQE
mmetsp:Transcript_27136/g.39333  ORF Transcript_27136/g.39333 Transcript_27136/m.39333 type:complete len:187 (+) Transcript_27136:67-627(+)